MCLINYEKYYSTTCIFKKQKNYNTWVRQYNGMLCERE